MISLALQAQIEAEMLLSKQQQERKKTELAYNYTTWIERVLGCDLWTKQQEIVSLLQKKHAVSVSSCHASGKSFIAGRAALAFLYAHKPSIVLTTAPTDRQVRRILWKEIRTAHAWAKRPLLGAPLLQELKLEDDWFMFGFTARDAEAFQGYHSPNILVVVDEASGVPDEIFEAIDGVLTSANSRLLMISNPLQTSGRFFKSFSDPSVGKVTISAFDTPNLARFGITLEDIESGDWRKKYKPKEEIAGFVTPAWVERQLSYGAESSFFISRVLGQFPSDGDLDVVVPLHYAVWCQNLEPDPDDEIVEIAVDVARFGRDDSIIGSRRGLNISIDKVLKSSDTMTVAGETVRIARELGAQKIKVDTIGIGAGVADRLREVTADDRNIEIVDMVSSERANDSEKFINKRAEWHFTAAEKMRSKNPDERPRLPDDDILIADLTAPRYEITSKGLIQIESKKNIKKRLKRSPDRGDVVMMLLAEDEDVFDIDVANIDAGGGRSAWRIE